MDKGVNRKFKKTTSSKSKVKRIAFLVFSTLGP